MFFARLLRWTRLATIAGRDLPFCGSQCKWRAVVFGNRSAKVAASSAARVCFYSNWFGFAFLLVANQFQCCELRLNSSFRQSMNAQRFAAHLSSKCNSWPQCDSTQLEFKVESLPNYRIFECFFALLIREEFSSFAQTASTANARRKKRNKSKLFLFCQTQNAKRAFLEQWKSDEQSSNCSCLSRFAPIWVCIWMRKSSTKRKTKTTSLFRCFRRSFALGFVLLVSAFFIQARITFCCRANQNRNQQTLFH